jgi:hypothetical protein
MEEIRVILVEAFAVGQDRPCSRGLADAELPAREPDGVTPGLENLVQEKQRIPMKLRLRCRFAVHSSPFP